MKEPGCLRSWRLAVIKRDLYLCQACKLKQPNIHAHHIESRSLCPELELVVDNGVCFCEHCHRLFHSMYGQRVRRQQFEEFMVNCEENGPQWLDDIEKEILTQNRLRTATNSIVNLSKIGGCFVGGEDTERAMIDTTSVVMIIEDLLKCSNGKARKWAWWLIQQSGCSKIFVRIDSSERMSRADIHAAIGGRDFASWYSLGSAEHNIRHQEKCGDLLPARDFQMSRKQIKRWVKAADGNPFALLKMCPWSNQMGEQWIECLLDRCGLLDQVSFLMISQALAWISTKGRDRSNQFSFILYWLREPRSIERAANEVEVEYPFVNHHPGYVLEIARRLDCRPKDISNFPWPSAICIRYPELQDPFLDRNRYWRNKSGYYCGDIVHSELSLFMGNDSMPGCSHSINENNPSLHTPPA